MIAFALPLREQRERLSSPRRPTPSTLGNSHSTKGDQEQRRMTVRDFTGEFATDFR